MWVNGVGLNSVSVCERCWLAELPSPIFPHVIISDEEKMREEWTSYQRTLVKGVGFYVGAYLSVFMSVTVTLDRCPEEDNSSELSACHDLVFHNNCLPSLLSLKWSIFTFNNTLETLLMSIILQAVLLVFMKYSDFSPWPCRTVSDHPTGTIDV